MNISAVVPPTFSLGAGGQTNTGDLNVGNTNYPPFTGDLEVTGNLTMDSPSAFIVNGNLYVHGNIDINNPGNFLVLGYVLTDGGMRTASQNQFSTHGIYTKGVAGVTYLNPAEPPGTLEIGYNTNFSNNNQDIYVQGNFKSSAPNLNTNNIVVNNEATMDNGLSKTTNNTFGNLKAIGNISLSNMTSSTLKNVYSGGGLSISSAVLSSGAESHLFGETGITINLSGVDIKGMMVSTGDITINDNNTLKVNEPQVIDIQSGIISQNKILINKTTNTIINGLIWSGGDLNLCEGAGSFKGAIMATQLIAGDSPCSSPYTNFLLQYDWPLVEPFQTSGGSGALGPITVVNWETQ